MTIMNLFLTTLLLIKMCEMISANDQAKRLILETEQSLDLGAEITDLRKELLDFQNKYEAYVNATTNELLRLSKENDNLKNSLTSATDGSVFVRWGRNICPTGTSQVYKGYMAGKKYNAKGSGTNHLCLPSDPTWLNYTDGVNTDRKSFIFGTEIDTDDNQHIFGYPVNEQDLPCAVCQSKRHVVLMVPARGNCYDGWFVEYRGYLMASTSENSAYEYICVDEHPQFLNHGATNDNQHIVYITEGRCGSLPCPPYVDGRELACVVCSK